MVVDELAARAGVLIRRGEHVEVRLVRGLGAEGAAALCIVRACQGMPCLAGWSRCCLRLAFGAAATAAAGSQQGCAGCPASGKRKAAPSADPHSNDIVPVAFGHRRSLCPGLIVPTRTCVIRTRCLECPKTSQTHYARQVPFRFLPRLFLFVFRMR